jgi:DNA-binding Lrp family transcriptional regulator
MENYENSGRKRCHRTDEYVEELLNLVHSDGRLNIRAMAEKLNLDRETVKKA